MRLFIVLFYVILAHSVICTIDGVRSKAKESKFREKKSNSKSGESISKKKSKHDLQDKMTVEFRKQCMSAVPKNFSPSQTEEFCSGISNAESLSCVKYSRTGNVKLSFEEIKLFCKGTCSLNYILHWNYIFLSISLV